MTNQNSYIYIHGNVYHENNLTATIDLSGGVQNSAGTYFTVENPLDSINFIWQVLDKTTGTDVFVELTRSFESPRTFTILFRNHFSVPDGRYRLLLFRTG